MIELTICILHYKKLNKLKQTINHVELNTGIPFLVKILNQGYQDDDINEYLSTLENKNNYRIIRNSSNVGPSAGRDILFKDITTRYVLSLDDDIYLPPGWYNEIGDFFEINNSIDIVGLSLQSPSGKPQPTAHQLDFVLRKVVKIRDNIVPGASQLISDRFYSTDYVSEGAMVLKSSVLNKFSWDSNLRVCFEGFDAGMQFRENSIRSVLYIGKPAIHDSISRKKGAREYNLERRNYHKIRKDYIHICTKWNVRFTLEKHIFYKYVCAIFPNPLLKWFAMVWLNLIKPALTGRDL